MSLQCSGVRTKQVRHVPTLSANTICMNCFTNCHIGCNAWGIFFCRRFTWGMKCDVCDCNFSYHQKQNYKYEVTNEEVDKESSRREEEATK